MPCAICAVTSPPPVGAMLAGADGVAVPPVVTGVPVVGVAPPAPDTGAVVPLMPGVALVAAPVPENKELMSPPIVPGPLKLPAPCVMPSISVRVLPPVIDPNPKEVAVCGNWLANAPATS